MLKRAVHFGLGILMLCAVGCASTSVRSSGATLPQTTEDFDDGQLKVVIKHECKKGRCTGFQAKLTNIGDSKIDLDPAGASISRAGTSLPLVAKPKPPMALSLEPNSSTEGEFYPVDTQNKVAHSYVRPKEVWCSMKVHSSCKNPAQGEALCAGFARYYYETHVATNGWVTISFPYKVRGKTETVTTLAPQAVGLPPAVRLAADTKAPGWLSNPDDIVFHKVECNEKCNCTELTKKRNFFLDDKFEPVSQ